MDNHSAGSEQGENIENTGGVDPTKPIGPGNPPASGMWQAGRSGNPDGNKRGQRTMRLILKDILNANAKIDEKGLKAAAEALGYDNVENITTRELMLLKQVQKAIKEANTQAFMALAKIAGEYSEGLDGLDGLLGQVILLRAGTERVNLDDFKDNPEAMEALLAEAAEEAAAEAAAKAQQ